MVAMKILSEKTKILLKQEFPIIENSIIKLYRGSGISKEEVEFYQKHINVVRQISCFLSTSIQKNVSEGFLQTTNLPLKALFEYELMVSTNPPFTFLGTNELDKYGEKEVLIHSGAIIQITNINENPKNNFNIHGKIFSTGWKGYFQYVAMNTDLNELNLKDNHFGNGKIETMQFIKEAIIANKGIKELVLSNNSFGNGKIEIMDLLKDSLIANESIKVLNLNNNCFGDGEIGNMQLLKEAIAKNKSRKLLYLFDNGFASAKKENMQLLKEALMENNSIEELDLGWNKFDAEEKNDFNKLFGEKMKLLI